MNTPAPLRVTPSSGQYLQPAPTGSAVFVVEAVAVPKY
jgi:hypothetical protein